MNSIELTAEEKTAIKAFKRFAKKWPRSLWLFSGAGTLWVMKKNADGDRAMLSGTGRVGGGVDQDC